MKFLIINGPNLNMVGRRDTSLYGDRSFDDYLGELSELFREHIIEYTQSNIEGRLVDILQAADGIYDGIIFNAGAYTHTSVAIADAVQACGTEVVEVHITSILSREDYRHVSLIAPHCRGTIMGFGLDSYRLGILSFLK